MVGVGGAGGGGGGGNINPPLPPPRIFAKFVARYSPLSFPVVWHNLHENYMKNLPKFTGERDLIAT